MAASKEHQLQRSIIEWCDEVGVAWWPEQRCPWSGEFAIFAIPNGGARDVRVATRLKREGVRRGVPDLFAPLLHLWLEVKVGKNKTTEEQQAWLAYLHLHGYRCAVVRSVDEAIEEMRAARARPR